jgi:ElaB/YqjD/DUF883 family membrane-anchored ribosome-binding protein
MEGSNAQGKLFNEFQQNRLSVSCSYIDGLLKDIEEVLNSTASKSPFPKYVSDISPAQRSTIEDYIARFRGRLVNVLKSVQVTLPVGNISAVHSLRTTLSCIEIAVEELKPRYMRGYGELPAEAQEALNRIVAELNELLQQFNSYTASLVPQITSERPEPFATGERK